MIITTEELPWALHAYGQLRAICMGDTQTIRTTLHRFEAVEKPGLAVFALGG